MSAPPTQPGGEATPAAPPGSDTDVLERAAGVQLLGEIPGSGYRRPPALARRGDGQVLQLTPLLAQTLTAVDGRRTVAEVAEAVSAATGRLVQAADVHQLVGSSLRPLGLLRRADGSEPELRRSDPLLSLKLRRVVTDPERTRRLTAPFAALFTPLLVVPVVLAFMAISSWVLFSQGLAAATAQAFDNPALFVAVVVVTVLSAGFHEFGHAAAARYGGATPGVMGAGFYLFWPAFYTDVTDSYTLGRAGRVRTDLGGLYFNALVVLASFAVWWATGWHAVLLIVATQILQMVRQLLPLLRFDGYHVLADLTGVPDLYSRIGPVMTGLLPGRSRQPEATALKTWARVVVVVWVLLAVPLMAITLLLMVVALPRLLATAWSALGEQGMLLTDAFGSGDVLGVLGRALGIVAVVVPLMGLGYVVLRLVRRIAGAVWRWSDSRPARRSLAVLVAIGLVAGLGWAWWPDADRYRPVRPWEGGTVLDAVPAAAGTALAEGSRGTGDTVWPADAGPPPTADRPALALVLVPASGASGSADSGSADSGSADSGSVDTGRGSAQPTWVFPFDRPLPPGEGDNQALAVNTVDGSVRYDVAFAIVWADGTSALNRNEAFAAASCTGCTTVAVAFQVVLLVGSVDVVVPQNLATAVNYACVDCITHALATQLVVSLDGPLDEDGQRQLTEIWADLADFAREVPDLALADIRARLTEYESRILEVVRAEGQPVSGSETADGEEPAVRTGQPAEPTGADDSGNTGAPDRGADGDDAGDTDSGGTPGSTDSAPTGGASSSTGSTSSPAGSAPTSSSPTSSAPTSTAPAGEPTTATGTSAAASTSPSG